MVSAVTCLASQTSLYTVTGYSRGTKVSSMLSLISEAPNLLLIPWLPAILTASLVLARAQSWPGLQLASDPTFD